MSAVLFTSDLHLGHARAAELRGFASVVQHDIAIKENWYDAVDENDIIWVLGDLCLAALPAALETLAGLPGRKRLILGNHDAGHPRNRNAHRWSRAYAEVFEHVASSARIKLQGQEALLSHFPYERDRGPMRHMQWRLPDLGVPLIHGHTHGTERRSTTPLGTPELHVGVDAWDLRPVADRELAALL